MFFFAAALVALIGFQTGKHVAWFLRAHRISPSKHEGPAVPQAVALHAEGRVAAIAGAMVAVTGPAPAITIISFTNQGMLDFALNWLHHLRLAIGPEAVATSLLMYVVGEDTRRALIGSGLLPEHCVR